MQVPLMRSFFFFFNDTATTEIYTLSLHDALPICVVGRAEIIRALRELGPSAPVSDVMVKDIPTIERSHRLEEAFRLLQEKSVPAVGVVDFAGRLIGLVTAETVGEMLMVRKALPEGAKLGPWSRPAGGWKPRAPTLSPGEITPTSSRERRPLSR